MGDEKLRSLSRTVIPKPRPEVSGLYRYPIRQEDRYERLRLDKNEHVSGFSEAVVQEMLDGISQHFLAAYPEPIELYRKIAAWHELELENVLITSGSELAIRYLFEAYLDRGDAIVFANPSFAMFEVYATLCGAQIVNIDYQPDLTIDIDAFIRAIQPRTKIVAIANPNNPTGTVIAESDLCRITETAAESAALVLVDEAYYHFYRNTMVDHLVEYDNLIVTRTFSKACGLASIRLGYALGHADVIDTIRKLQPIDHANAFALKLGAYIVDHQDLIWDYVEQVEEGKAYLAGELQQKGFTPLSSHGNFLLIDFQDKRDQVCQRFEAHGILIGTHVRLPFPNNYIRVTLGSVREMRRVVEALEEVL